MPHKSSIRLPSPRRIVNQTFAIYLLQAGAMGLLGSLGCSSGCGDPGALTGAVTRRASLTVEPTPALWPVIQGTLVGLGLALLFAVVPSYPCVKRLCVRCAPPMKTISTRAVASSNRGKPSLSSVLSSLRHLTGRMIMRSDSPEAPRWPSCSWQR